MSLDTLANVKVRLGVTTSADDTLFGLLQDSGDSVVANYCNRDFAGGTFTEFFPGGSEFVPLRNYPVASVTSVKVDPAYAFGSDTIIPITAYVLHTDRGMIQARRAVRAWRANWPRQCRRARLDLPCHASFRSFTRQRPTKCQQTSKKHMPG